MKRRIFTVITLVTMIFTIPGFSQSPQGIKYQAIARDASGNVLNDTEVAFNISIIQDSPGGAVIYNEQHPVITNSYGMVTLTVGQGETGDDFSSIDWSNGPYFINIEIDGISMGTSQLLSVPYALYAKEAGNVFSGDYNNLNNKPDLSGYITEESDPVFSASAAAGITSADTDKWNQAYDFTPDPEMPVPVKYQGDIIYVYPMFFSSMEWGENNLLTGAKSDTDGKSNTEKIVAALGDSIYPAKTCSDLNAFGYDNWYLPSLYEIDAIYKQSYLLKYISYSSQYWSSTEMNKDMAWKINFYSGAQSGDSKKREYSFVCVRRDY